MRDDAAPGPLTQALAPHSGSPRNRQIPWGESAPARLGREDPRNFGSGTLASKGLFQPLGKALRDAERDDLLHRGVANRLHRAEVSKQDALPRGPNALD